MDTIKTYEEADKVLGSKTTEVIRLGGKQYLFTRLGGGNIAAHGPKPRSMRAIEYVPDGSVILHTAEPDTIETLTEFEAWIEPWIGTKIRTRKETWDYVAGMRIEESGWLAD